MDEPSYANQSNWRSLMAALPPRLHLTDEELPTEECWQWRGNQIHIDAYRPAPANAKIILHHGVGTNGRQMTLLVGQRLAQRGFAVVAPDNLGYGVSRVTQPRVKFDDWVDLLDDLISAELDRDNLPVFLFGLSAGGMLCFHAAAKNGYVKGVVGLTFLDERIYRVRHETVIHPLIAPFVPLVVGLGRIPFLSKLKVPMKWVSKMHTLSNDKVLLKHFLADPTSSGALVSLEFLASFMSYRPAVEAKDFDGCPILLAQPENDRWTREELSRISLRDIRAPFHIRALGGAGHYPTEEPGLGQLEDYIVEFVQGEGGAAKGESPQQAV